MRISLLAALTVAALATAGCASGTGGTPTGQAPTSASTSGTATAAPTLTGPVAAVPEALKFTATTVDGKTFDAAALAGRPGVLWFWAAWCPKCRGDAANVRDLQQQLAGKVNIVGVAGLGSGTDGMKKFVADYKLDSFPQLADDAGTVWKKFAVPSQHYYIVLDKSGTVVHRGPLTVQQLQQKLAGLF